MAFDKCGLEADREGHRLAGSEVGTAHRWFTGLSALCKLPPRDLLYFKFLQFPVESCQQLLLL